MQSDTRRIMPFVSFFLCIQGDVLFIVKEGGRSNGTKTKCFS